MARKIARPDIEPDDEEIADDANASARSIIERITGEKMPRAKNPAAVALGKLGASKGGKARAEKLSARKRAQIAKRAAAARWKK
jgi:hypothetical protein